MSQKNDPCIKAPLQANKGDYKGALNNILRCIKQTKTQMKKIGYTHEIIPSMKKQLARAYRLQAQIYFSQELIPKSLNSFKMTLDTIKNLPEDKDIQLLKAHVDYSVGLIHFLDDKIDDSIIHYTRAKNNFIKLKMHKEATDIIFRLIDISIRTGEIALSQSLIKEGKSTHKRIKDKKIKKLVPPRLRIKQSKIFLLENKELEAQKELEKAKSEYIKLDNPEGQIECLLELSNLYMATDLLKSHEQLLEALDTVKLIDSLHLLGVIYTKLGIISLKLGDFEKGQTRLLKGLEYKSKTGDELGTAQAILELSRISLLTSTNEDDLRKSENFAQQAYDIYDKNKQEYGKAQSLELLGTVNTKLGNFDAANSQISLGRKFYKKFKDKNSEARMLTQLGIILDLQDRNDDSIIVLKKAEKFYTDLKNIQGLAEVYQIFGNTLEDKKEAVNYMKKSKEIYAQIIGDNEKLKPILFTLDVKIKELEG